METEKDPKKVEGIIPEDEVISTKSFNKKLGIN